MSEAKKKLFRNKDSQGERQNKFDTNQGSKMKKNSDNMNHNVVPIDNLDCGAPLTDLDLPAASATFNPITLEIPSPDDGNTNSNTKRNEGEEHSTNEEEQNPYKVELISDEAELKPNEVELIPNEAELKSDEAELKPDEAELKPDEVELKQMKQKRTKLIYKSIRILCMIGFFIFSALFLNEVWIQPILADRAKDKAKTLYQIPAPDNSEDTYTFPDTVQAEEGNEETNKEDVLKKQEYTPQPTPDPNRDEIGRLLQFRALLDVNPDVKGWIKLNNLNGKNDTKIDYVVVQPRKSDPEYYLTRDWLGNKVKSGSLFLDVKSSVEENSQNLVIHGHNMTSTDDMFHYLLRYNDKEFYDSHPIIDFNTIYQMGQWKVFAVFITNGSSEKEPLFDYTISDFKDTSDFLDFVYQIRIRSIYNAEDIDINENDQLLTLSTCSYEVKNYRTVIVARRVRDGEDPVVNTENIYTNPEPLYPGSFYYRYGGKAPKLTATFEEAYVAGEINWYKPNKE